MKKTLLPALTLLIGQSIFAQSTPVSTSPLNKNAVLEELTGINCQYCPDGHLLANNLAAANPGRVILVNVHAGGYANTTPDLRTTDGTALDGFFNPTGYPAGAVQRTAFGTETRLATGRQNWTNMVNTALGQASPVNVAMDATIDATTRQLTLHVEMYYTQPFASGTNHYLNIGILQNNFEGPQVSGNVWNPTAVLPNGNYLHQHVFRGFINAGGTWGDVIDASQTGVITRTVTYTLPANVGAIPLDIANLQFFAFLQEGHNTYTNSKIITGAEVEPELVNIPTAEASLNSIINTFNVCEGSAIQPVVKVMNNGDDITALKFSTVINGGTPIIYDWTGTIDALHAQEITLPAMNFTAQGTNSITITITEVNGGAGDLGSVVTQTKPISIATEGGAGWVTVKMTTDRYGSETTWKLFNSAGAVVGQGGPYTDAGASGAYPQPDVNLTLANDCYTAIVYDAYGDGFDSGYGNGNFEIVTGTVQLASVATFSTGSSSRDAMKINAVAGVDDLAGAIGLNIFPNPASDKLSVAFNADNADYTVTLVDLQGRVITTNVYTALSGEQVINVPVTGVATGNYIVKVSANGATAIQNVMIK